MRLLARWRARGQPEPVDLTGQLTALLDIANRAVRHHGDADRVVAALGAPGPVRGDLAGQANRLIIAYRRLRDDLAAAPSGRATAAQRDQLSRLLHYHQWILHEANHLASGNTAGEPRVEAARRRLTGLGAPAGYLRDLRDDLAEKLGRT